MDQNTILIIALVVLGLIIIWPDVVLQVVGVLAVIAGPAGLGFGGFSPILVAFMGLALIALGRIVFTARKINQLLREAHPEAAARVKIARWF